MQGKFQGRAVLSALAGVLLATVALTATQAAAKRGGELFEKRCTGCHALDTIKAGPLLRGVFSRLSASDPRFPYSDALKKAKITWDTAALDRWLMNPDAVAPDNDMSFRLDSAEERAAIIAFLKELSGK